MAAHVAGEGGIADDASELPVVLHSNPEVRTKDILEAFGLEAPASQHRSP